MEGEGPGDLQKEGQMIKVEHIDVRGMHAAIRGMRNPMNSWDRSDSYDVDLDEGGPSIYIIGDADLKLMKQLLQAGPEHRKYLRMIMVYMDITAPLYWWKEYDTYKVSTVANSCSTMHKITSKPIEVSDFSMDDFYITDEGIDLKDCFINVVADCEMLRNKYLETKDKRYWRGLIQLLPSSYNQKRTVMINYETALSMIRQRSGHKLNEWREFVQVLQDLPYMKILVER